MIYVTLRSNISSSDELLFINQATVYIENICYHCWRWTIIF